MKRVLCAMLVLGACVESAERDAVPEPPGGFEAFTPRTRSVAVANGDRYQLSITDAVGPLACELAQDQRTGLAAAGHQIIASIGFGSEDAACPLGRHEIREDCQNVLVVPDHLAVAPMRCAYYRRFDEAGELVGMLRATEGRINVTGDASSCLFEVKLSILGTPFEDTFTLIDGEGANPWCQ